MKPISQIVESNLPDVALLRPAFNNAAGYLNNYKLRDYGIEPQGLELKRKGVLIDPSQFDEVTFQDLMENAYSAEGEATDAFEEEAMAEKLEEPEEFQAEAKNKSAKQYAFERNVPAHEALVKWAEKNEKLKNGSIFIEASDSEEIKNEKLKKRHIIILLELYKLRSDAVGCPGYFQRFPALFDESELLLSKDDAKDKIKFGRDFLVEGLLFQPNVFKSFVKKLRNKRLEEDHPEIKAENEALEKIAESFIAAIQQIFKQFDANIAPKVEARFTPLREAFDKLYRESYASETAINELENILKGSQKSDMENDVDSLGIHELFDDSNLSKNEQSDEEFVDNSYDQKSYSLVENWRNSNAFGVKNSVEAGKVESAEELALAYKHVLRNELLILKNTLEKVKDFTALVEDNVDMAAAKLEINTILEALLKFARLLKEFRQFRLSQEEQKIVDKFEVALKRIVPRGFYVSSFLSELSKDDVDYAMQQNEFIKAFQSAFTVSLEVEVAILEDELEQILKNEAEVKASIIKAQEENADEVLKILNKKSASLAGAFYLTLERLVSIGLNEVKFKGYSQKFQETFSSKREEEIKFEENEADINDGIKFGENEIESQNKPQEEREEDNAIIQQSEKLRENVEISEDIINIEGRGVGEEHPVVGEPGQYNSYLVVESRLMNANQQSQLLSNENKNKATGSDIDNHISSEQSLLAKKAENNEELPKTFWNRHKGKIIGGVLVVGAVAAVVVGAGLVATGAFALVVPAVVAVVGAGKVATAISAAAAATAAVATVVAGAVVSAVVGALVKRFGSKEADKGAQAPEQNKFVPKSGPGSQDNKNEEAASLVRADPVEQNQFVQQFEPGSQKNGYKKEEIASLVRADRVEQNQFVQQFEPGSQARQGKLNTWENLREGKRPGDLPPVDQNSENNNHKFTN